MPRLGQVAKDDAHPLAQLALDQAVAGLEVSGNDRVAESFQHLVAAPWQKDLGEWLRSMDLLAELVLPG